MTADITLVPGMARTELSQLGLRLHRPRGLGLVSNMWSCVGDEVKVNTYRGSVVTASFKQHEVFLTPLYDKRAEKEREQRALDKLEPNGRTKIFTS